MRAWLRYWGRLWDLEREPPTEEETEDTASYEQTPPTPRRRPVRPGLGRSTAWLRGARQPLPPRLRARLEGQLGVALSSVGVRHDPAATAALDAAAFAVGDDIVVGEPGGMVDERLLTHEAVHIAQARTRGTYDGVSQASAASEREAERLTNEMSHGAVAEVNAGDPVPAVQRQPTPRAAAPANPVVRREAVRIMLIHQYQEQGGKGPFKLTPMVLSEMRRLLPETNTAILALLWLPEPAGPLAVFQRILDAGLLPLAAMEPAPAAPPPQAKPAEPPKKAARVAPADLGMLGIHLRLNVQTPAPISATIRQRLVNRGLPLDDRVREALLAGRAQGVEQIEAVLRALTPSITKQDATKLAETIADVLLDIAVSGQLKGEAPSRMEILEDQADIFKGLQGPLPSLLKRIPFGVSVTVYF